MSPYSGPRDCSYRPGGKWQHLTTKHQAYLLSSRAWQEGGFRELQQVDKVEITKCQHLPTFCPQSQGPSLAVLHLLKITSQHPHGNESWIQSCYMQHRTFPPGAGDGCRNPSHALLHSVILMSGVYFAKCGLENKSELIQLKFPELSACGRPTGECSCQWDPLLRAPAVALAGLGVRPSQGPMVVSTHTRRVSFQLSTNP